MLTHSSPCMGRNGACLVPIFNLQGKKTLSLHACAPVASVSGSYNRNRIACLKKLLLLLTHKPFPKLGVRGTGLCNITLLLTEHLVRLVADGRGELQSIGSALSYALRIVAHGAGRELPRSCLTAGDAEERTNRVPLHEPGVAQPEPLPSVSLPNISPSAVPYEHFHAMDIEVLPKGPRGCAWAAEPPEQRWDPGRDLWLLLFSPL